MTEKDRSAAPKITENLSVKIWYEESTHDHREKVVMFKQKSAKLERLLSQLPSENSAKTATVLNAILREKGFWGTNGAADSFAYFLETPSGPILVLNTIADGGRNTKLGDIDTLLERIRVALEEGKALDRSNPIAMNIHKYSHLAAVYDSSLSDIERTYQKDTNDLFRVADSVKGVFSDETGRKIYEKMNASTRKNIWETYNKFLQDFQTNPPTTEKEIRSFSMINAKFQNLINHEFDGGKSTTQDIGEFLWETKWQMLENAWYGLLGEAKGLIMSVCGIVLVFAALVMGSVKLMTDGEARKNFLPSLMKAVQSMGKFIVEKSSDPKAAMKEFGEALQEKFDELSKLPPEQQAEAIGYFAGEIVGMLEGWILLKWVLKSKILRIKFGAEVWERFPISKVTDWADLDKFVNTIDHIRFRGGWDAAKLSKTIEEVRLGKLKLTDIPDVGGIRGKVQELLANWGKIQDSAKTIESIAKKTQVTEKLYGGAVGKMEDFQKKMSVIFEKGLDGKIVALYDALDAKITAALAQIGKGATVAKIPFAMIGKEYDALKAAVAWADFPKKAEVTRLLKSIEKQVKDANDFLGNVDEHGRAKVSANKVENKLSRKEIGNLTYRDGMASREVMEDGVLKHELYDSTGRLIGGKRFDEVVEIRDGVAFVKDQGGIGILRMNGTFEVPIQKWVFQIQSMEREGVSGYMLGLKDGEGKISFVFSKNGILQGGERKYDFFGNLEQGMWVATGKTKGGKNIKYLIDAEGWKKPIPLELPDKLKNNKEYVQQYRGLNRTPHVDMFTKEWVAAVRLPDGRWSILDKEGKYIWKDETQDIGIKTAKSGLEALQKYYKEMRIGVYKGVVNHADEASAFVKEAQKMAERITRGQGGLENIRHTGVGHLYEFTSKEGKVGFLNLETKKVVASEYSHIQFMDAPSGFLRFEKNGKWGVMDWSGKTLIEAKYDSLNVLDEQKKIFETGLAMVWGKTKVGILEAGGKEYLPATFDYIETLDSGLYRWVNYKSRTLERANASIPIDVRSAVKESVGKKSDTVTNLALGWELTHDLKKTGGFDNVVELYANPKIRAFMDGDVSQILALFRFDKHSSLLDKIIHPFKTSAVFRAVQEILAKELSLETTSKKNMKAFTKLLALRAKDVTDALKNQTKWLPKNEKAYSFASLSQGIQQA